MSWYKPLFVVLILAACGYQPVYGTGGRVVDLEGHISTRAPVTVEDFAFEQRLVERLGPVTNSRYHLDYVLTTASTRQAITRSETTTQYALNGTVAYRLTDLNGDEVLTGEVSNFTSYSSTGTTVATVAAERDAQDRLARMLADQLVTRLLAARLP